MATKREHAVAVLDALDSKARLTSRTILGSCIAAVFLLIVAYVTIWHYAVGGALLIGSRISYRRQLEEAYEFYNIRPEGGNLGVEHQGYALPSAPDVSSMVSGDTQKAYSPTEIDKETGLPKAPEF